MILELSFLHHWMHHNTVTMYIMSPYVKNSLHNPTLKFPSNTIGSMADLPVGKHQREWVSQVKPEPREIL